MSAGTSPRRPRTAATGRGRDGSAATVRRFDARARQARRRSRRPVVVAAVIATFLVALVVFALTGPVLVVRDVQVRGVSAARAATIVEAADVVTGEKLLRLHVQGVRRRVRALPFVAAVTVHRAWPSTVVLQVDARTPAVAVRATGGGYHLVDDGGVEYTTVTTLPAGLPVITRTGGPDPEATLTAVLSVLRGMPAGLRAEVTQLSADSPQDVSLRIGKATVLWGGPDRTARKVEVFDVLRHTPAKTYDVSSPDTPVLR